MEILLPHRVEYLVDGPVSVDDFIASLQAQQKIALEFGVLLQGLFEGIQVQKNELRIRKITSGSLKEAFFIALFVAYQKELQAAVPPMVEQILGVSIDQEHHVLVTISIVLLVFYGADYAYKRLTDQLGSKRIERKLNDAIEELAHATGKSSPEIRRIVERQFSRRERVKELAKASVKFFRPSRNGGNAPVVVGDQRIEREALQDIPNQVDLKVLDREEHSVPIYGTRIEIRQKDHDHDGQGWGGIVATISDARKPVRLYPHVSRDYLWEHDLVWADILVTYRVTATGHEPIRYHIMNILHEPPSHSGGPTDIQPPQGTSRKNRP